MFRTKRTVYIYNRIEICAVYYEYSLLHPKIDKYIFFCILHFIESCNHVIFISSRSVHAAPLLVNDGEVVDAGDDEVSYGAMIKS